MYEEGSTPEQKIFNVEFQILPTGYHTWGCPVFFLGSPLQGGPARLPKWEPISRNGLYLGHYPFRYGSVYLVLNTRTGQVSPQYHMVFYNTLSIVDHIRKGKFPVKWKNMVEEHSEISAQKLPLLQNSGI